MWSILRGARTAPGRPPTIFGHHPARQTRGERADGEQPVSAARLAAQSACSASRACKQLPAAHEVACKQFNMVATLPPPPPPPPGGDPLTILISVQSLLSICRQTRMATQAQIRIKRTISKHACMHVHRPEPVAACSPAAVHDAPLNACCAAARWQAALPHPDPSHGPHMPGMQSTRRAAAGPQHARPCSMWTPLTTTQLSCSR